MKKLGLLQRLVLIPAVATATSCGSTAEIQPKGAPCEGGTKTGLTADQGTATIHGLPPLSELDIDLTIRGFGLQIRPSNRIILFPRQDQQGFINPKPNKWYRVNTNGTRVSVIWNDTGNMFIDGGWGLYEGEEFCYTKVGEPVYKRVIPGSSKER